MTKAFIDLQDLRRRIYVKAKAEPSWRFWGLYVHVCKMETLRAAYEMAKENDGAPGIDGVTFEAIETQGVEALLEQLRDELIGWRLIFGSTFTANRLTSGRASTAWRSWSSSRWGWIRSSARCSLLQSSPRPDQAADL
ncbi:hypothetical protein ACVIQT_009629 [Bradyrhizobium diazoefficiens]